MNILLLTSTNDKRVKAGVETYNNYLKKVFPGLKTISYETVKPSAFEWFSPLKEPLKANAVCSFVKENIQKLKPDIVITNGMYGWNITPNDTKCPIVNVSHGSFIGLALDAIKRTNLEFYRTLIVYAFFERLGAKNASVVVANSRLTVELNRKYYGVNPVIIHNPVDTQTFVPVEKNHSRKKLGLGLDKTIGLFVGRPEHQKGFDMIEKIAQRRPEIKFISLTFPKTKSAVKNIIGILPKDRKRLALYYSAADFVLFPSRFEGFGFVPLEALACNTPVISSDVGVVREIKVGGLHKLAGLELGKWLEAIDLVIAKKRKAKSAGFVRKKFGLAAFRNKFLDLVKDMQELQQTMKIIR